MGLPALEVKLLLTLERKGLRGALLSQEILSPRSDILLGLGKREESKGEEDFPSFSEKKKVQKRGGHSRPFLKEHRTWTQRENREQKKKKPFKASRNEKEILPVTAPWWKKEPFLWLRKEKGRGRRYGKKKKKNHGRGKTEEKKEVGGENISVNEGGAVIVGKEGATVMGGGGGGNLSRGG